MMTDGSGGSTASPKLRIAYLTEAELSAEALVAKRLRFWRDRVSDSR